MLQISLLYDPADALPLAQAEHQPQAAKSMNLLTPKSRIQEEALLKRCTEMPKTAIHVLNIGRSNNATTYSDAFCDAAADLIRLYRASGVADPIDRLSRQLMASKVVSCRGLPMDHAKTTYLYRTKLEQRLKNN